MLTLVSMKWGRKYGARHVNILGSMLSRHLHMDHEFVCITDDPDGVTCRTIPLWEDESEGCFRRLDLFKPEMRDLLGERFVSVDLDCVIASDVTPIFARTEDFIAWRHPHYAGRYCGSMFMMDAGARPQVATAPRARTAKWPGTDQEVMSDVLGPNEAVWSEDDGIYSKLLIGDRLPENARIVFYPGPRDPSTDKSAVEHWR